MVKEMRGLALFIQDIRGCKSAEAEQKRINKEMANIRHKFGAKKALSGYDLKKYVSKLVFTFLLGNEIEFGHEEAIQLMRSPKFSEKQAGYLFISVLFTDAHEMMDKVGEIVGQDIKSDKQLDCCLALHCVANIGGKVLAEAVGPVLGKLFKAKETPPFVKKKVALALLKLLREGSVQYLAKPEYVKAMSQVLQRAEYGVLTSAASLAIALGLRYPEEYESCVPDVVTMLHRLVLKGVDDDQYKYAKNVTAPWICVKLIRFLQIFSPPSDPAVLERLNAALGAIMNLGPLKQWSNSEGVKDAIVRWRAYANKERNQLEAFPERNINPKRLEREIARRKPKPPQKKMNACLSMCFEGANLICHYDNDQEQQEHAAALMGKLIDPTAEVHSATLSDNPNIRFLALESLASLAQTTYARTEVKKNLPEILASLKSDARDDPTVHRKAVDVLYNACDKDTVQTVVKELLVFLKKSDYSIREDVVLKIAILSEKYATDFTWYVNIILTLIKIAGDHVTDEVWHRVLQIVVGRPEVQDHAARICFEALLDPTCHEAMVKVGAYVLGEFGHLIANDPACIPEKQLEVLQRHYPMMSTQTRGLLLSTYVKQGNLFPEMRTTLDAVFAASNLAKASDAEIQQRANEYRHLLQASDELINTVLDEMPAFAEKESSSALAKLEKNKSAGADAVGVSAGRAKRPKAPPGGAAAKAAAAAASATKADAEPTSETAVNNDAFFDKFMLMDNGVLYENPVLQIGCKAVYGDPSASRAKITIFYGNRSASDVFTNITTRVYAEDEVALKLHAGDVDSSLKPEVQLQQVVQCDVTAPFASPPMLECALTFQNRRITVTMKLPILPNKFYTPLPAPLDAAAFGDKWRQIGGPPREFVQVVTTKSKLTPESLKAKLAGYKLPATDNIDPNPQNCAAITVWTTSTGVIGVLVRIELKDQACRVTVRAPNDTAAPIVAAALCAMLALC